MIDHEVAGKPAMECLVDQITFIVLAPYIGPKAAMDAIGASRRSLDLDSL